MGSASMKSEEERTPGPIPVCTARTFIPFLDFLIKTGAPVDRWLERCQLPFQVYEDPDASIPTMNYWSFVALAETEEGIVDLGLRVAHDHIYETHGLGVVARTHAAPTLLAGIEEFSRRVCGEYSGMRVVLARGEEDTVRLILHKSFEIGTPGYTQTEWMGLVSLMAVVQLFAGRSWQPDVISLRSTRAIPPLAHAFYPDVHIMRNQPNCYVSFPKTLLSRGPSTFGAEVLSRFGSKSSNLTPSVPPVDFADSLQRLLVTYFLDGYPSLEMMAEIANMSPRTLQRRLSEDGRDYSWLVKKTRFEIASRMLMETDASSLDIANATGYEDPSHFARAFKRIAGCSPREFRGRHAD